jgi:hypothetical protein
MSKKRQPTRAEFDRLTRLLHLLDAAFHELTGNHSGIGYFLPVKYVDWFCTCGQIDKRIGEIRSLLDDLACGAEENHSATSVFYGNDAARTLAKSCVSQMLADAEPVLPEKFMSSSAVRQP